LRTIRPPIQASWAFAKLAAQPDIVRFWLDPLDPVDVDGARVLNLGKPV